VTTRVYGLVFVGAAAGGATRLAIDAAIPTHHWAWDILAINAVGSLLLGVVMGWFSSHVAPRWLPLVGPGFMGGFTTFSSMAAPHPDAPVQAGTLLVIALAVCAAGAGLGWLGGDKLALSRGARERRLTARELEDEVMGEDPGARA